MRVRLPRSRDLDFFFFFRPCGCDSLVGTVLFALCYFSDRQDGSADTVCDRSRHFKVHPRGRGNVGRRTFDCKHVLYVQAAVVGARDESSFCILVAAGHKVTLSQTIDSALSAKEKFCSELKVALFT